MHKEKSPEKSSMNITATHTLQHPYIASSFGELCKIIIIFLLFRYYMLWLNGKD